MVSQSPSAMLYFSSAKPSIFRWQLFRHTTQKVDGKAGFRYYPNLHPHHPIRCRPCIQLLNWRYWCRDRRPHRALDLFVKSSTWRSQQCRWRKSLIPMSFFLALAPVIKISEKAQLWASGCPDRHERQNRWCHQHLRDWHNPRERQYPWIRLGQKTNSQCTTARVQKTLFHFFLLWFIREFDSFR